MKKRIGVLQYRQIKGMDGLQSKSKFCVVDGYEGNLEHATHFRVERIDDQGNWEIEVITEKIAEGAKEITTDRLQIGEVSPALLAVLEPPPALQPSDVAIQTVSFEGESQEIWDERCRFWAEQYEQFPLLVDLVESSRKQWIDCINTTHLTSLLTHFTKQIHQETGDTNIKIPFFTVIDLFINFFSTQYANQIEQLLEREARQQDEELPWMIKRIVRATLMERIQVCMNPFFEPQTLH